MGVPGGVGLSMPHVSWMTLDVFERFWFKPFNALITSYSLEAWTLDKYYQQQRWERFADTLGAPPRYTLFVDMLRA
jgi:hypothetical protein